MIDVHDTDRLQCSAVLKTGYFVKLMVFPHPVRQQLLNKSSVSKILQFTAKAS